MHSRENFLILILKIRICSKDTSVFRIVKILVDSYCNDLLYNLQIRTLQVSSFDNMLIFSSSKDKNSLGVKMYFCDCANLLRTISSGPVIIFISRKCMQLSGISLTLFLHPSLLSSLLISPQKRIQCLLM